MIELHSNAGSLIPEPVPGPAPASTAIGRKQRGRVLARRGRRGGGDKAG